MKSADQQPDILIDFLSELARLLLESGVDVLAFQRSAQLAFVQAAVRKARLRNSRVNQSAVAAVTGLSRPQVRTLLRLAESKKPTVSGDVIGRLERIWAAWQSDPEFLDGDGRPRALSIGARRHGFSRLVGKYANDVSQPALLAEFTRLGYAQRRGSRLHLRKMKHRDEGSQAIASIAAGLAHSIRDIALSQQASCQVLTGEAEYTSPDPTASILLQRRIAQGVRALCADIQSAGEATSGVRHRGAITRKTKTRILVITGN